MSELTAKPCRSEKGNASLRTRWANFAAVVAGLIVIGAFGFRLNRFWQEELIYEVVVRNIASYAEYSTPSRIYFVAIDGKDPSPLFFRRMSNEVFSVRDCSGLDQKDQETGTTAMDRKTNESGIVVNLTKILWSDPRGPSIWLGPEGVIMRKVDGAWTVYGGFIGEG